MTKIDNMTTTTFNLNNAVHRIDFIDSIEPGVQILNNKKRFIVKGMDKDGFFGRVHSWKGTSGSWSPFFFQWSALSDNHEDPVFIVEKL